MLSLPPMVRGSRSPALTDRPPPICRLTRRRSNQTSWPHWESPAFHTSACFYLCPLSTDRTNHRHVVPPPLSVRCTVLSRLRANEQIDARRCAPSLPLRGGEHSPPGWTRRAVVLTQQARLSA